MNAERLLAHFERISESPNAIARLRRFILDLAVRGKLVEQDPEDEPAEELLAHIAEARFSLIQSGKRKKQNQLFGDHDDEPFELPNCWQWARLPEMADFSAGRTPARSEDRYWNPGLFHWVSIGDMEDGRPLSATKELVSKLAGEAVFRSEPEPVGTMIMSFKLTIGKMARLAVPAFHNEAIISIHPYLESLDPYLFKVIPIFARSADSKGAIKGATLNRDSISRIPIPLPPLAEQHRIVAKVNELMALCDQLEAARQQRQQCRGRLVAASLQRLNQPAADPVSFRNDASFALQVLPSLTTTPAQIKQLRQTILNLAVRGKLVEQDPEDEPAEEWLRILSLHTHLDSRKSRRIQQDSDNNHLITLPRGWALSAFCNIARVKSNLVDPASHHEEPHIAPDCIESWTGRLLGFQTVGESGVTSPKHLFEPGVILYSKIRPNLAKAVKVDFGGLCSADMYPIEPLIDRDFLLKYMISSLFVEQATAGDNRVAMPKINQAALNQILVPLPPLAEQHRIVAKVDELMALCDQLEQQLSQADQQRRRLLEAVLAEALGGRLTVEEESHANVA